jgi:hypothetical protein
MKNAFGPNLFSLGAGEGNRSEGQSGAVRRVDQYAYDAVGS